MRHELYMQRCLELAEGGLGYTAPNPLVGAVLVHQNRIIGEGYHKQFGGPHAEVEAIRNAPESLLKESVLYVSLEPCNHTGKTPPCTDLIIQKGIPEVVFAMPDPNPLVAGTGSERLQEAGIKVTYGFCQEDAAWQNRRFIKWMRHKQPYIILKWAESADHYLGAHGVRTTISGKESQRYSHKWRTEEAAILVGAGTVFTDDPELTSRYWPGRNPVRVVVDDGRGIDKKYRVFQGEDTLLISISSGSAPEAVVKKIFDTLYQNQLQSVIVEGGAKTLSLFLSTGNWDEARVFSSNNVLAGGVKAPVMELNPVKVLKPGADTLRLYIKPAGL